MEIESCRSPSRSVTRSKQSFQNDLRWIDLIRYKSVAQSDLRVGSILQCTLDYNENFWKIVIVNRINGPLRFPKWSKISQSAPISLYYKALERLLQTVIMKICSFSAIDWGWNDANWAKLWEFCGAFGRSTPPLTAVPQRLVNRVYHVIYVCNELCIFV